MKTTSLLIFISLIFCSIFSCNKSENSLIQPKAQKIMGIDDDVPDNVRVIVENREGNSPYIVAQIVPADNPTASPIDFRVVPGDVGINSVLFFTLPVGTAYIVKVIDQTGVPTFSEPEVAGNGTNHYFPIPPPNTPVPPIAPPPPILIPSQPEPDPEPEPGKYPFTLTVNSWSGQQVVEASIVSAWNPYGEPLQKKILVSDSFGVKKYKKEVTFNIAEGVDFRVLLRDDYGAAIISSIITKTNMPQTYTFY